MRSLRTRLLLAASCVLAVFMVLTGAGLDRAFQESAQEAQYDKMQGLVYALIGVAEQRPRAVLAIAPSSLPHLRFMPPLSGLEALIIDDHSRVVWRSPSVSAPTERVETPAVGSSVFHN